MEHDGCAALGMEETEVKVYLAGPEVFSPDPQKEATLHKKVCEEYGFEGVFPLDNVPDIKGLAGWEAGEAIFNSNIDKIDECGALIANMTPFRGPGMDAGTAFEMGYANAQGKTTIGWSSDDRTYIDRVREFYDGDLKQTDRWRDPNNLVVEDFGEPDNLMMSVAAIDVTTSFEGAVKLLSRVLEEIDKLELS